jgi:hypothetical protein
MLRLWMLAPLLAHLTGPRWMEQQVPLHARVLMARRTAAVLDSPMLNPPTTISPVATHRGPRLTYAQTITDGIITLADPVFVLVTDAELASSLTADELMSLESRAPTQANCLLGGSVTEGKFSPKVIHPLTRCVHVARHHLCRYISMLVACGQVCNLCHFSL